MPTDPPEPPHPLDAGLRAQAARRRAELGVEDPKMPGPMRTQLQAEVARQFENAGRPNEDHRGFLTWLFQWQRGLATVAVALLMIGLFAWNGGWFSPAPASNAKQAVLNEEAPATAGRERAAKSVPVSDAIAKRSDAPVVGRDAKEQEKAPAVTAPAPPVDNLAAGKIAAAPKPAAETPTGATATASAPAAAEPRSEAFESKAETTARLRQNFAQTPAQVLDRARKAASVDEQTSQLLNQFEFRQSGNRVEIVEADGSVYAGEIDVAKKDAFAPKDRAKAAARPPVAAMKDKAGALAEAQGPAVATQFNFRASGVSNTLRQKVTIEGLYQAPAVPTQNAPGASAGGGMASQNAAKSSRAQAQQAQQVPSRARVVGRAQVNGRNVDVEAEATK